MAKKIDVNEYIGNKYGRLTVVEYLGMIDGKRKYLCRCDCGNERTLPIYDLKSGHTKSCGCLMREMTVERNRTHGGHKTRLYKIWGGMKTRCHNSNSPKYKDYGGRGIAVCQEWRDNFDTFRDWATTNGYAEDLSLDRINVDGNYEPDNCRWSDMKTQARNKRNNRYITLNGETLTIATWAERTGIKAITIRSRLNSGWSVEKTLTTPVKKASGKCKSRSERLYMVWQSMRQRCYNNNCAQYNNYGGRGITVCDEWRTSYSAFKEWALANGHKDGLSLDRIDVDSGYSPSNCRWATAKEQSRNRRNNRYITFNGETLALAAWAERTGISKDTIYMRLAAGWSVEKALTTPVRQYKKRPASA